MKKLIGFTLLLALLLSMLGCDTVPAPTEPSGATEATTQGTVESIPEETKPVWPYEPLRYKSEHYYDYFKLMDGDHFEEKIQYLPETVENPDNLPVLKWVCFRNDDSTQPWSEDAVHEINQMLADRDMPYRVQFVMITGDLYLEILSKPHIQAMLQEADLIFATTNPEQRQKYLLPITEYVTGDAQPTLKNAVVHEYSWIGAMADGEIYGIPTNIRNPSSHGWRIKSEVLTKYGLTVEDFQRNFWEMDEIFAKIYKANGNQPFLPRYSSGYGSGPIGKEGILTIETTLTDLLSNILQAAGLTFCIDATGGTPKVVNSLETDVARRVQEAIIRYKDAGYTVDSSGKHPVEIIYGGLSGAEVVYCEQEVGKSVENYIYIPVTECYFNSSYDNIAVSGVGAGTKYKKHAVSLLNLIAEDEAFRHQLLFGKEGRDYTLTDGKYQAIESDEGAYYTMDFLSMLSAFDPIKEQDLHPICHEGKTKLETYLANMDSAVCWYPIAFDYTGLEAEVESYTKVLVDYVWCLVNNEERVETKTINGLEHERRIPRMDREAYDEMLEKLNDAGGEKICAELQRQLDEWLANNPDWQPTGG